MSKHLYSTTVTVDVDVDIDTDDLEDQDLLEICQERGLMSGGMPGEVIEELFVLFKQGKHDQVLQRVRRLVEDAKGVVL
jgi:hypothetical protein